MENQNNLFKTKRFAPLFITQFLGAFNDNAFKNAFLIWFTYEVSLFHGLDASIMVTFAGGLFILPFFLFSATAGQLSDKYEKSWLTQKIKLIEIVLMLLCGFFFYIKSVEGLLIILFLMGVQSTFFGPIKYSLLPEHLKENELVTGNAWIEGGTFLSILLGTIFGGVIITLPFGSMILAFFLILFAIIGYISSFSIPKAHIFDSQLKISLNFIRETSKIISYARKDKKVWLSILAISWFWYIGITFLTLFPVYTNFVMKGNELLVTFFMTTFSLGIGVGSALCSSLLKGKITGKFIPISVLCMSLSIILLVISSIFYLDSTPSTQGSINIYDFITMNIWSCGIITGILLLSIFGGIYIVPLYAIMQHFSDKKYISRIIAGNNIINSLFMVVASLFSSILLSFGLDTIDVFSIVGILNFIVFTYIVITIKRRAYNA